jgi:hypothetical protein
VKPNLAFREVVAFMLLAMFAWAYANNPHNDAIIGALLTSFAAAWGFYLGGSKVGADTAAKNADTVAAQAAAATETASGVQDVNVVNASKNPVPVETNK